jgi:hypothetical protein
VISKEAGQGHLENAVESDVEGGEVGIDARNFHYAYTIPHCSIYDAIRPALMSDGVSCERAGPPR